MRCLSCGKQWCYYSHTEEFIFKDGVLIECSDCERESQLREEKALVAAVEEMFYE